MNKVKLITSVVICLVLSCLIVLGYSFAGESEIFADSSKNEISILKQEIEYFSHDEVEYHNIYYKGQLLGIVTDYDKLQSRMNDLYHEVYEEDFPDSKVTLGEDYYMTVTNDFGIVSNIDEEIYNFLVQNDGFGLEVDIVELSTKEGVYASVAVKDINDFKKAKDSFLQNFLRVEELRKLSNGIRPGDLSDVGNQTIGFKVLETISSRKGIANPDNIIMNEQEALQYLCYGDNQDFEYYTVKEGDTISSICYLNNYSPEQILTINQDTIHSRDQILEPGMKVNVTYFTSPITVVVTKENLKIETVYPDLPLYIEDKGMYEGEKETIQNEVNGSEYVLYEETWVNGVLKKGTRKSSSTISQPIQGVIAVGTKLKPYVGTGNLMMPINNVVGTSGWGWRPEFGGFHRGIDIIDIYNAYGPIYAPDNGTIAETGYNDAFGNYVEIDHHNGLYTRYFHMSEIAGWYVGETIMKGDRIGNIGTTGDSTGPHLHFEIWENGENVDPCNYLNCGAFSWW